MMKALNEYELTKERNDELFGFRASCFVRNGVVWNEYYVVYRGLPLKQINDIFYMSEEEAIGTYANLPIAYINDNVKANLNTYVVYSPKYKLEPHIIESEGFTCTINEDMEIEAIHLVNDDGDLVDIDVTIDHDNHIIYTTSDIGTATLYFDDTRRICKSELLIDNNIESISKIEYDDENLESIETLTGGPDFDDLVFYSIYTKYDTDGKKLYMLLNDKTDYDSNIISSITRRINMGRDAYIEFTKFKID